MADSRRIGAYPCANVGDPRVQRGRLQGYRAAQQWPSTWDPLTWTLLTADMIMARTFRRRCRRSTPRAVARRRVVRPRITPVGGMTMKILLSLFGLGEPDPDDVRRFLDEAERLADSDDPLVAMTFLRRKSRGLGKSIGPDGPFHDRFVRVLHKVKSRVYASNPDAPRKVERNWDNLPSVLQIPLLSENIEISELLEGVKAENKDLVWLVPGASRPTQQDVKTMIDYTFHFADDPQLALQFHEWNGHLLIRRSFLLGIAAHLRSPTVGDLLVDTMKLAISGGWTVRRV